MSHRTNWGHFLYGVNNRLFDSRLKLQKLKITNKSAIHHAEETLGQEWQNIKNQLN